MGQKKTPSWDSVRRGPMHRQVAAAVAATGAAEEEPPAARRASTDELHLGELELSTGNHSPAPRLLFTQVLKREYQRVQCRHSESQAQEDCAACVFEKGGKILMLRRCLECCKIASLRHFDRFKQDFLLLLAVDEDRILQISNDMAFELQKAPPASLNSLMFRFLSGFPEIFDIKKEFSALVSHFEKHNLAFRTIMITELQNHLKAALVKCLGCEGRGDSAPWEGTVDYLHSKIEASFKQALKDGMLGEKQMRIIESRTKMKKFVNDQLLTEAWKIEYRQHVLDPAKEMIANQDKHALKGLMKEKIPLVFDSLRQRFIDLALIKQDGKISKIIQEIVDIPPDRIYKSVTRAPPFSDRSQTNLQPRTSSTFDTRTRTHNPFPPPSPSPPHPSIQTFFQSRMSSASDTPRMHTDVPNPPPNARSARLPPPNVPQTPLKPVFVNPHSPPPAPPAPASAPTPPPPRPKPLCKNRSRGNGGKPPLFLSLYIKCLEALVLDVA